MYVELQQHLENNRDILDIGIGPGAAGRITVNGKRHSFSAIRLPQKWMKSIETKGHGIMEESILSHNENVIEVLLTGLRTSLGVTRNKFRQITGTNDFTKLLNANKLAQLEEMNLLVIDNNTMKVTSNGLIVLDTLIKQILSHEINKAYEKIVNFLYALFLE